MHKDEAKGTAKEIKGSMKQTAGKATGDKSLEAKGATERAAGKAQKGLGALKDAARDVLKN